MEYIKEGIFVDNWIINKLVVGRRNKVRCNMIIDEREILKVVWRFRMFLFLFRNYYFYLGIFFKI